MAYLALYRQWRPQKFSDVVGQKHISMTLKNAIKSERIVHAYLFSGPRGTGKTSSAKIMAKAVNCLAPIEGEACNECSSCQSINEGLSMDIIEIDAASNRGIDEIRDLREKVKYAPVESRYKVYIIDEVHMLTSEAFNALLKTLEEPPKHVIFILATTEPHKIPLTVLSRCQRFDFKRIGYHDIEAHLREIMEANQLTADDRAISLIAKKAEGSMRDALSLLDQCLSFSENRVTEDTVAQVMGTVDGEFLKSFIDAIAQKDYKIILDRVETLVGEGKDLRQFLRDLLEYLRNLLLVKISGNKALAELPDYIREVLPEQSGLFSEGKLFQIIEALSDAEVQLRYSAQNRISLEIALLKAMGMKDEIREEVPPRIKEAKQNRTPEPEKSDQAAERIEKPEPDVESGALDLESIKEHWKKLLEVVRKSNPSTYAYLVAGEPKEYREGKIRLLYKPNMRLHLEQLVQPAHRPLIEKSLMAVYRKKLTLEGFMASEKEKEGDLAAASRKLFGDIILEIKE